MIIRLFACAEHVLVDKQFNDASLINLLDELSAAAFPVVNPYFQFLAVLDRTDDESAQHAGQFVLRIGDQVLLATEVSVDFVDQERTRCVGTLHGLSIPSPGDLEAVFTVAGVEAKWLTRVKSTSQPQLTTESVASGAQANEATANS